jgi:hypothetical protein
MPHKSTEQTKPSKHVTTLILLSAHLAPIPTDIDYPERRGYLEKSYTHIISNMALIFRVLLKFALKIFEIMPFWMGCGYKKFKHLKLEDQSKYINLWAQNKFPMTRDIFLKLKAIISIVVFSDKKIWPHLGYTPDEYTNERIQIRQKIINETRTNSHIQ